MATKNHSQVSQLSPAERLVEQEVEHRMAAYGLAYEQVSYYSIAIKLAAKLLLAKKKLKAAENSLKEAESCAEDFVGSNWLKTTLMKLGQCNKLQPSLDDRDTTTITSAHRINSKAKLVVK
jgi:hypothetical protein